MTMSLHARARKHLLELFMREDVILLKYSGGFDVPNVAPRELPQDLREFHDAGREWTVAFRHRDEPADMVHGFSAIDVAIGPYDKPRLVKLEPKELAAASPPGAYGGKSKKRPSVFDDYDYEGPWYYGDGDEDPGYTPQELGMFCWEVDKAKGTHIPAKGSTIYFLFGDPMVEAVVLELTSKGQAMYLYLDAQRCFHPLQVSTFTELIERGIERNFAHHWFLPDISPEAIALQRHLAQPAACPPTLRVRVASVTRVSGTAWKEVLFDEGTAFELLMEALGRKEDRTTPKLIAMAIIDELLAGPELSYEAGTWLKYLCGIEGGEGTMDDARNVWNEPERIAVAVELEWLRYEGKVGTYPLRAFLLIPPFAGNPYVKIPLPEVMMKPRPGHRGSFDDWYTSAPIHRHVELATIPREKGTASVLYFKPELIGNVVPGEWTLCDWGGLSSFP